MIKLMLLKVIKNLAGMILAPKLILWSMKQAVELTTNTVDDNVVNIVKAGYENDEIAMKKAVENLLSHLKRK